MELARRMLFPSKSGGERIPLIVVEVAQPSVTKELSPLDITGVLSELTPQEEVPNQNRIVGKSLRMPRPWSLRETLRMGYR